MNLKNENKIRDKFDNHKLDFTEIFLFGMFFGAVALLVVQNMILGL